MTGYLGLLDTEGTYIQVGIPDGGDLPPITAFSLIFSGIKIGGSLIGAPAVIRDMLQLAADRKVKPWIQTKPMREANQAITDFTAGKPRYRFVLVNDV